MLKNGQTYFKNLAVWTPQDFLNMFNHYSTLCMKEIKKFIFVFVSVDTLYEKFGGMR